MKTLAKLALIATLAIFQTASLSAEEFTKGKVEKIDMKAKKVTVAHEELKGLEMPAMTMVFRTSDDAMLEDLQEGQEIEFVAERINGKLTITQVK